MAALSAPNDAADQAQRQLDHMGWSGWTARVEDDILEAVPPGWGEDPVEIARLVDGEWVTSFEGDDLFELTEAAMLDAQAQAVR